MASDLNGSPDLSKDQTAGAGPSQPQRNFGGDTSPTAKYQRVQLSPETKFKPMRGSDDEGVACPDVLHSHVSMDFFDPKGVRKLSRTLSRVSAKELPISEEPREEEESEISEEALKTDDQFDFEKAVRTYIRKYVSNFSILLLIILTDMILNRKGEADIKTRQLGVLFENLGVVGLGASASYQQTLGSLFNPMNVIHKLQSFRHPPLRNILTDFEGVVRPGEMLRPYPNQIFSSCS
jgi:ATP-binding cassette subfamily G (WHITE) protein 2 (SNQ2)